MAAVTRVTDKTNHARADKRRQAGGCVRTVDLPSICLAGKGQIQALVFAGNMHVFHHATLAMKQLKLATESSILVIKGKRSHHHANILDLARKKGWGQIIELDYQDADRAFNRPFLGRVKRAIQAVRLYGILSTLIVLRSQVAQMAEMLSNVDVEFIISGIYASPLERSVSASIPHRNFVLVDDGNMTSATALGRKAESAALYKKTLDTNNHKGRDCLKRRFINKLYRRLCHVNDTGEARIIFYTAHNLRVQSPDQIIRMKYGQGASIVENDVAHILGMPVISRRIVSPEFYGEILCHIALHSSGKRLFYFPHPSEESVDLQLVSRFLPAARIEEYRHGYESELLMQGRHPGSIYSCYSSAIRNVMSMDLAGLEMNVIRIPEERFLDNDRRQKVGEIYHALRQIQGLKFIDL